MGEATPLGAAGAAMWNLVERYTGHVGYKGGAKASDLLATPPVIDCSGCAELLLAAGRRPANASANDELFRDSDFAEIHTWSDRMIEVLELRSGVILESDCINLDTLLRDDRAAVRRRCLGRR